MLIGMLLVAAAVFGISITSESAAPAQRIEPFDQYGKLRWEDEKARLDNFAFALATNPHYVGYILVYDGKDVCAGEAEARALRAKRYVVEHRGIPWNRVIWRRDGYNEKFETILEPIRRDIAVPYPFTRSSASSDLVQTHVDKNCATRMTAIKKSSFKN
jgi:hypothetical protein